MARTQQPPFVPVSEELAGKVCAALKDEPFSDAVKDAYIELRVACFLEECLPSMAVGFHEWARVSGGRSR